MPYKNHHIDAAKFAAWVQAQIDAAERTVLHRSLNSQTRLVINAKLEVLYDVQRAIDACLVRRTTNGQVTVNEQCAP